MSTPNEIVSQRIVDALQAKDILLPASVKGLAENLSSGQLGSSQWVTLFGLDQKARKQDVRDQT